MKAPKPEAAPKGWITTGFCGSCLLPIETLHPCGDPPKVRHVAVKRPYGACDAARKSQTSNNKESQ